MIRRLCWVACASAIAAVLLFGSIGQSQNAAQKSLEPVAETKLLMQGMASANFHGLERIFETKPTDYKYWVFARGQALLIAETANLLMMRPPRGAGEAPWFEHATDLRKTATQLVYKIAEQNYAETRAGIVQLANSCNRCHDKFRVGAHIAPFEKRQ